MLARPKQRVGGIKYRPKINCSSKNMRWVVDDELLMMNSCVNARVDE